MVENNAIVLDARRIRGLYNILSRFYGPQGWWPLRSRRITAGANIMHSIGFNSGGYHPNISYAPDSADQFEIAAGAVLTQNTSWHNASAAIDVLIKNGVLSAERIIQLPHEHLSNMIRPSGYYNQKALKLKALAVLLSDAEKVPRREELLSLWGIGPETADSILLYAFGVQSFVIDAYTRRILSRFNGDAVIIDTRYDELQAAVQTAFHNDLDAFREFHALFVNHAKQFCAKKPRCSGCPVWRACKKRKCLQNS